MAILSTVGAIGSRAFNVGGLYGTLHLIDQPFYEALARADKSLAIAAVQMEKSFAQMKDSANSTAHTFLAIAGIVGVGIGAAVYKFAEFERQMRNVNSILQESESTYKQMSQNVKEFAKELGAFSPEDLAKGLYQVASSGNFGAKGMMVLKESAESAVAGLADVETSVKAVSGILNAYGLQAEDAKRVSDALFQTVNLGIVTYQELAQNIGDVTALAASARIPINEVGAAIAAVTRAGYVPAEAMTRINQFIRAFEKPTKEMKEFFKIMGVTTGEELFSKYGMGGAAESLYKYTGGSPTKLNMLVEDKRAAEGAITLLRNQVKDFKDLLKQFDWSYLYGAKDRALEQQKKSFSFQFNQIKQDMTNLVLQIGERLVPAVKSAVTFVQGLAHAFESVDNILSKVNKNWMAQIVIYSAARGGFEKLRAGMMDYAKGVSENKLKGMYAANAYEQAQAKQYAYEHEGSGVPLNPLEKRVIAAKGKPVGYMAQLNASMEAQQIEVEMAKVAKEISNWEDEILATKTRIKEVDKEINASARQVEQTTRNITKIKEYDATELSSKWMNNQAKQLELNKQLEAQQIKLNGLKETYNDLFIVQASRSSEVSKELNAIEKESGQITQTRLENADKIEGINTKLTAKQAKLNNLQAEGSLLEEKYLNLVEKQNNDLLRQKEIEQEILRIKEAQKQSMLEAATAVVKTSTERIKQIKAEAQQLNDIQAAARRDLEVGEKEGIKRRQLMGNLPANSVKHKNLAAKEDAWDTERFALQTSISDIDAQKVKLNVEAQGLLARQEINKETIKNLKNTQAETIELTEQNKKLIQQLEIEQARIEKSSKTLATQIKEKEVQLETNNNKRTALTTEVQTLETKLKTKRAEQDKLVTEQNSLAVQRQKLTNEQKTLPTMNEELALMKMETEEEIKQLEASIKQMQQQSKQLVSEQTQIDKQLESLRIKQQTSEQDTLALEARRKELMTTQEQLSAERTLLETQQAELETKIKTTKENTANLVGIQKIGVGLLDILKSLGRMVAWMVAIEAIFWAWDKIMEKIEERKMREIKRYEGEKAALENQVDIRKRMAESIQYQIDKYNGLTSAIDKNTAAHKSVKKEQEELKRTQAELTNLTKIASNMFGFQVGSLTNVVTAAGNAKAALLDLAETNRKIAIVGASTELSKSVMEFGAKDNNFIPAPVMRSVIKDWNSTQGNKQISTSNVDVSGMGWLVKPLSWFGLGSGKTKYSRVSLDNLSYIEKGKLYAKVYEKLDEYKRSAAYQVLDKEHKDNYEKIWQQLSGIYKNYLILENAKKGIQADETPKPAAIPNVPMIGDTNATVEIEKDAKDVAANLTAKMAKAKDLFANGKYIEASAVLQEAKSIATGLIAKYPYSGEAIPKTRINAKTGKSEETTQDKIRRINIQTRAEVNPKAHTALGEIGNMQGELLRMYVGESKAVDDSRMNEIMTNAAKQRLGLSNLTLAGTENLDQVISSVLGNSFSAYSALISNRDSLAKSAAAGRPKLDEAFKLMADQSPTGKLKFLEFVNQNKLREVMGTQEQYTSSQNAVEALQNDLENAAVNMLDALVNVYDRGDKDSGIIISKIMELFNKLNNIPGLKGSTKLLAATKQAIKNILDKEISNDKNLFSQDKMTAKQYNDKMNGYISTRVQGEQVFNPREISAIQDGSYDTSKSERMRLLENVGKQFSDNLIDYSAAMTQLELIPTNDNIELNQKKQDIIKAISNTFMQRNSKVYADQNKQLDTEIANRELYRVTSPTMAIEDLRKRIRLAEAERDSNPKVDTAEVKQKTEDLNTLIENYHYEISRIQIEAFKNFGSVIWNAQRDRSAIQTYFYEVVHKYASDTFSDNFNKLFAKDGSLMGALSRARFKDGSSILDKFSKYKPFMKSVATVYSGLEGLAGINGEGYASAADAAGGGFLQGATSGAVAGSEWGLPGMVIGGLVGGIYGLFKSQNDWQEKAQKLREAQLAELQKLNNALQPMNDYFKSIGLNNLPFSQVVTANPATNYAVVSSRGVR